MVVNLLGRESVAEFEITNLECLSFPQCIRQSGFSWGRQCGSVESILVCRFTCRMSASWTPEMFLCFVITFISSETIVCNTKSLFKPAST